MALQGLVYKGFIGVDWKQVEKSGVKAVDVVSLYYSLSVTAHLVNFCENLKSNYCLLCVLPPSKTITPSSSSINYNNHIFTLHTNQNLYLNVSYQHVKAQILGQ